MKATKRAPVSDPRSEPAAATDLPTVTALKLWVVLSRTYAAIAEVAKAQVETHDMTPGEFGILEVLYHKGPMLLGEVQKKVLASSGGITFLVDRLSARGLVERLACPSDRRARYAALTKRGQKLMGEVFPAHAAVLREAMSGLSRADQRVVTDLLKVLGKEAMRQASETPGCKSALANPPA